MTIDRTRITSPLRRMGVLLLLLGLLSLTRLSAQSTQPQVLVLHLDDTITPAMASYIDDGFARANSLDADVVILQIDTPGGLESAMNDVIADVEESDIPVVAFIGPDDAHAEASGVFVAYAADAIAMSPDATIGPASLVENSAGDAPTDRVNDDVSRIRQLAEAHDHDAGWVETSIREGSSLPADQALDKGVIAYVATDVQDLLTQLDGERITTSGGSTTMVETSGIQIVNDEMNAWEGFLQAISDPTIAFLLLSFGILGILLEISQPGGFVAGTLGTLTLLAGLYALNGIPVEWAGVTMIGLAFALFVIDLFVSSFGLLLVSGMILYILGSYRLVDPSVPGYGNVSRPVIWTCAVLVLLSALTVGYLVLRTQRKRPYSGTSALIGQLAEVRSTLSPTGMVYVDGEYWTATAEGDADIPVGSTVKITAVDGLKLSVRVADPVPRPQLGNPLPSGTRS